MYKDDHFRVYRIEDSDTLIDGLLQNKLFGSGRSDPEYKAETEMGKRKLLSIIRSDMILEYRFSLTYLTKIAALDSVKEKASIDTLTRLSSISIAYSTSLHPALEKLGEKTGTVDLPYRFEDHNVERIVLSHLYIEHKILRSYEKLLSENKYDKWLTGMIELLIEKKTENIDAIKRIGKIWEKINLRSAE